MNKKEYQKKYRKEHKEKISKYFKKNRKKLNELTKTYRKKNLKRYRDYGKRAYIKTKNERPWVAAYFSAGSRCKYKNNKVYNFYGGRGIKFLMTMEDFKYLWFRDKAYLMEKPSIHREDSDGNYETSNCSYIEFVDNCRANKRRIK